MILTEILFKTTNLLAGTSWLVLIFTPTHFAPRAWISKGWMSTALSLIYFISIVIGFEGFQNGGGFSSIADVRTLFQYDWLLLAGWIHYLAFDLLIGATVAKDLDCKPWFIKTICLSLTFLFGPIGWLCSRLFLQKKENQ